MSYGDNRQITVGNAGTLPKVIKQPGDTFIYVMDFATWIDTGIETVTAASVSVTTTGTPPVCTVDSHTNTTVLIKVVGGTNGAIGTITITTTFSNSEVKTTELTISVQEFP